MHKNIVFFLEFYAHFACGGSDVSGTVTALYSCVSDVNAQTQNLVEQLAVALNRDSDSSTQMFAVNKVFEIDGSAACSITTNLSAPTSVGSGTGCQRVTFDILKAANLTEYEVRYMVEFWSIDFALSASDLSGQFSVAIPPHSPSAPNYTWQPPSPSYYSSWTQRLYPQDAWIAQPQLCTSGSACASLTIAPSMRYMHSSILYTSWNFSRDVLPHATLCNLPTALNNTGCNATCLTDMTSCAGASSMSEYFTNVSDSIFWSSSFFAHDDGFPQSVADSHQATCPKACCGSRRLCMRTADDLGRTVPFDRSYLLQFGGLTRQKLEINGEDLYLNCEAILATINITENQSLSSCYEIQSDELWRMDISSDTWELLKPRTASTVFPSGRYGHAAALVEIPASTDLQHTRRQYMYIFGGLSIDCANGLCIDLWRYEIPWAAQAYWSTSGYATPTTWIRGNVWTQLKSSPFGGRFRHTMQGTASALYVFGGQQMGGWDDRLLIYRLASDSWDVVAAEGYRYFTRSVVDYLGASLSVNMTDFSQFGLATDSLGEVGILGSPGVHPPQFPLGRGDQSCWKTVNSSGSSTMWIANGFRAFDVLEAPDFDYYLDNDIWQYSIDDNVWLNVFPNSSVTPAPRRGASVALREDLLLMFGGMNGDTLFSDMWMMNLSSRIWQQIDENMSKTIYPPGVVYHSLDYDPNSDSFILFGGLNWTQSNLTLSDALVGADRTCLSTATALLKTQCVGDPTNASCALALAVENLSSACATNPKGFCCSAAQWTNSTNLQDLSETCTSVCDANSFASELTIGFGEGLWIYTPFAGCEFDCGSRGVCYFSQCVCQPGFTGNDCSLQTCPGSICYFDTNQLSSVCSHCSNNGNCTLVVGKCACENGWTGPDCSEVACDPDCNGICLPDFPVHQCICPAGFSGSNCQDQLCLNGCSLAGTCSAGECMCNQNFYGTDCSVYIMSASFEMATHSLWLLVLVLTL